jgi:hypothetical protein
MIKNIINLINFKQNKPNIFTNFIENNNTNNNETVRNKSLQLNDVFMGFYKISFFI